eukprot:TRINITY_DN2577_c0_g2_i1.p1 TRINITY_DN2577_c0_g2~~TRINITY_DN2577_c0_g2_i1.p1  ORF type:complete len:255 (+),score=19.49 TRINITY_DN2577_c0_g2_i1:173-937(+)
MHSKVEENQKSIIKELFQRVKDPRCFDRVIDDEEDLVRRGVDGKCYPKEWICKDWDVRFADYAGWTFNHSLQIERIVDEMQSEGGVVLFKIKFIGFELDLGDWYPQQQLEEYYINKWLSEDKRVLSSVRKNYVQHNAFNGYIEDSKKYDQFEILVEACAAVQSVEQKQCKLDLSDSENVYPSIDRNNSNNIPQNNQTGDHLQNNIISMKCQNQQKTATVGSSCGKLSQSFYNQGIMQNYYNNQFCQNGRRNFYG